MAPHNIFFFAAIFFLAGIMTASAGWPLPAIILTTALAGVLFFCRGWLNARPFYFWLAGLAVFFFIGGLYFYVDDFIFKKNQVLVFGEKIDFRGEVIDNPRSGNGRQQAQIELFAPLAGRILANLPLYPKVIYGDVLDFSGRIKPLPDGADDPAGAGYGRYLAKERLAGIADFPEFAITGQNQGHWLKAGLFHLRNAVIGKFQEFLPGPQAAFMSGLTLGERGEFSEEFKEALNRSGTTHLVALSGYNITVLATAILSIFSYFFRRRSAWILTILAIAGFVVMTGAEASVARAGLMGILAILAQQAGRLFDFRNAVVLAALVMVLVNPKVLVFDVGFQLSFLALLGIVYLKPVLRNLFSTAGRDGFLNWRDNFWTTAAAQLAVLPVLLLNFEYFSLTSIAANLLVLELAPLTMAVGFLLAGFSFVSGFLAWLASWPALLLLNVAMVIIGFFGRWAWLWHGVFDYPFLIVYYLTIVSTVFYYHRYERRKNQR